MLKVFKKAIVYLLVISSIIAVFIVVFEYFYDTRNKCQYEKTVGFLAEKYGVSEQLVFAVIKTESNFNERAKSQKNALGIMQIKKETFDFVCQRFGLTFSSEDIFESDKNIQVGVCYLKYLIDKFEIEEVAICAYNAGEGNVIKWLGDKNYSDDGKTLKVIPFKETRNYLSKIKFYKKVFEFI